MADNAFPHIGDWPRAQRVSNSWEAKHIHARLHALARLFCQTYRDFATGYHGSVDPCGQRVVTLSGHRPLSHYEARHAAYDLKKLRGKKLVEKIGSSHRY